MKKYYLLSFLGIVLLGVFLACSDEEEVPPGTETVVPGTDHNILIAYFSEPIPDGVDANSSASRVVVDGELYGSVEYMAAVIGEATGGDMARIRTAQSYPGNYDDLAAQVDEERQSDARPELSTVIENFDDYDVVFVGYPIWWYQMPMAMYTFFDTYDFAGKTLLPRRERLVRHAWRHHGIGARRHVGDRPQRFPRRRGRVGRGHSSMAARHWYC